ncbi:ATP-binding protein [Streptomyces phyllanthi]|nr:ATP-binding protein [Streptomyces phyllanthi]
MPERSEPVHEFAMQFTSTPRGARLARRLVSHRLNDWGHPYASPVNEALSLIAAELTSNAVRHGHVPGRDFHVQLTVAGDACRIEVTDTRAEKQLPTEHRTLSPDSASDCDSEFESESESGRGLLLVEALADKWGVAPRPSAPGKTVWAELLARPTDTDATATSDLLGSRTG